MDFLPMKIRLSKVSFRHGPCAGFCAAVMDSACLFGCGRGFAGRSVSICRKLPFGIRRGIQGKNGDMDNIYIEPEKNADNTDKSTAP